MSDNMNAGAVTVAEEQFSKGSDAWKEQSDPIFRFWTEGTGGAFRSLVSAPAGISATKRHCVSIGRLGPFQAVLFVHTRSHLYARADYAQAEPLYRRALAIDEASLGPRPSQRRHRAQQPGRASPRHQPALERRIPDAPGAGHR